MMLGCDTAVRRSQSPSHSTAALRLVAPPSRQQLDTLYWKIRAHEHKIMGSCSQLVLCYGPATFFSAPVGGSCSSCCSGLSSQARIAGQRPRQISIILLIMRVIRFCIPPCPSYSSSSSSSQRLLGCSVLVLGNLHGFTPFTLLVYLFCIER